MFGRMSYHLQCRSFAHKILELSSIGADYATRQLTLLFAYQYFADSNNQAIMHLGLYWSHYQQSRMTYAHLEK